jgi:SAM-dependent methyltransferase
MSDTPGNVDVFGNATAYEVYVGRWSRLVGEKFVRWLEVAPGSTWLDVGAGTGILTQVILDQTSPKKVVAVDLSEQYLAYARKMVTDERVEFKLGNASEMGYDTPEFDAAVAGLVLNFVPSAEAAVEGMKQAVKSGGTVAAYVWDYGDRMQMIRQFWDAAITVDPSAKAFDPGTTFAVCDPDNLRSLFMEAGLKQVEVIPIDIETKFRDFDDFWTPFQAAQGSLSKYFRSLDEAGREAIRNQLLRQLPIHEDGTIALTARAWAAKGIR